MRPLSCCMPSSDALRCDADWVVQCPKFIQGLASREEGSAPGRNKERCTLQTRFRLQPADQRRHALGCRTNDHLDTISAWDSGSKQHEPCRSETLRVARDMTLTLVSRKAPLQRVVPGPVEVARAGPRCQRTARARAVEALEVVRSIKKVVQEQRALRATMIDK
jgi:hypothetical protein